MGSQPRPQLLLWLKTYSQLFGTRKGIRTHQWIITKNKNITDNTMMKQIWGLDRNNVLRWTLGDHGMSIIHHWITGVKKKKKKKKQLKSGGPSNKATIENSFPSTGPEPGTPAWNTRKLTTRLNLISNTVYLIYKLAMSTDSDYWSPFSLSKLLGSPW